VIDGDYSLWLDKSGAKKQLIFLVKCINKLNPLLWKSDYPWFEDLNFGRAR
jgi:hypothetical protein